MASPTILSVAIASVSTTATLGAHIWAGLEPCTHWIARIATVLSIITVLAWMMVGFTWAVRRIEHALGSGHHDRMENAALLAAVSRNDHTTITDLHGRR